MKLWFKEKSYHTFKPDHTIILIRIVNRFKFIIYTFFNCLSWVATWEAPRSYKMGHRFCSQLSKCQSNSWDKIIKKVDFLDRTTYFKFFVALNILYCNFLKFLMVTEEGNPAVRTRGWIQPLWPKKPKLANIKLLSLTYYIRTAF